MNERLPLLANTEAHLGYRGGSTTAVQA